MQDGPFVQHQKGAKYPLGYLQKITKLMAPQQRAAARWFFGVGYKCDLEIGESSQAHFVEDG